MKRPDELGCDLEGEAGLPGTARPGNRQESRPVRKQRDELLELPLSPHERDRDDRQVGCVERAERRELAVAKLEESLGANEVLQAVLTEIPNVGIALQQTPGRGREDDLASVRRRRDPCRAMDVDSDVAFFGQLRLTGMDPHANADRASAERLVRGGCRRDRVGCSCEGDEEGVALGVDLDAVVPRERSLECRAVFGEEIGVLGAVLLEEPRGAFDIREEKSDGSGRQLWPRHARDDRIGAVGSSAGSGEVRFTSDVRLQGAARDTRKAASRFDLAVDVGDAAVSPTFVRTIR